MKPTLHIIILVLAMLSTTASRATACPAPDDRSDKMSREQLAEVQGREIASALSLNDTNTKKFVELFSQCQKEIWAAAPPPCPRDKNAKKELSEKEAEKVIKDRFSHKKKITAIQEKYYSKYSSFLTQRQILQAYDLERQMMDRMFRQHMRRNNKDNGTNNKQPRAQKRAKK